MRRNRRGASPPRRSGDDVGPQGIPAPAILDTTTQRFRFYLIALGLLVAFYLLYRRFVDSPTGRVCAVEFLAWLREEDIPLAGARQRDLERWLATGTSTRRRIGPFLAWMAETRIGPRLSLPATALGTGPRITKGERVELITRLFHDASVDLDTRVAGLFLSLFAQPVARTARLRVDDVKRHLDGLVTVAFGHEPAPLPCPLDRLTSEQLHRADATGSLWLLPGHVPGHHITTNALTSKLRDVGIVIRAGKNSALDALVSELPAALAADATGYSPTTTVRHSAAAGVPWAAYPGRRRP